MYRTRRLVVTDGVTESHTLSLPLVPLSASLLSLLLLACLLPFVLTYLDGRVRLTMTMTMAGPEARCTNAEF